MEHLAECRECLKEDDGFTLIPRHRTTLIYASSRPSL